MDPPTIVKNINSSSSSQHPMFAVSQNPHPLHFNNSFQQNNNINLPFQSIPNYINPKNPSDKTLENEAIDDTEISIFDAHKYFSDFPKDINPQHPRHLDRPAHDDSLSWVSVSSADRHFRTRSFHATPTASSEASWNSRTGLLAKPQGSIGVSMVNVSLDDSKKRNPGSAKKWIFGRKCCCTGKKSVQVKEAKLDSENLGSVMMINNNNGGSNGKTSSLTAEIMEEIHQAKIRVPNSVRMSPEKTFPAADVPRQQRESAPGGFTFPILNRNSQSLIKGVFAKSPSADLLEDPPRESLEVFQPVNHRQHFSHGSPIARDDDMCSDASSDLFEIESFSTQTTSYPMYRRTDSLEEAPTFNAKRFAAANGLNLYKSDEEPPTPSVAATECYPPSEVSVDWSVTTAEGFDKASVSNFSVSASEVGILRQRMQEESCGGDSGKKKGNGGGGLLLMSCRQEKAVSVGPPPLKCAPAEGPQNFTAHVGARPPTRANKPPLGNSHSARLSLAFAA